MTEFDKPGEMLSRMAGTWEKLKSSDDARQTLVGDMFKMLHHMQEKNESLESEIETLKYHEQHFTKDRKRLEAENRALSQQGEIGPFVFVVIDGDNTLFKDEFISGGLGGGAKAAQRLQEALKIYLDKQLGVQEHRKLVVRIYVQLKGLMDTYNKARIGSSLDTFRSFVLGFNRELPLTEFVDAGDDKEAADNKIKANLDLYWKDIHCKHLLLAASADRGYVSFLRQYSTEKTGSEKLTLIEAVQFPPAFQELASRFKVTTFDEVFRSQKISLQLQNGQAATASATITTGNEAATTTTASSGTGSYASTAASSPQVWRTVPIKHSAASSSAASDSGSSTRKMQFNRVGQRIDEDLPHYDNDVVKTLYGRNLCHRYFLSHCKLDPLDCPANHHPQLSVGEVDALRRVARMKPCTTGPKCKDRDCVSGHHCLYDENCIHGSSCRFGSTHGIDWTVTKVV